MSLTRWCCSWEGRHAAVVTGTQIGRLSLTGAGAGQDDGENCCGPGIAGMLPLADAVPGEPRSCHPEGENHRTGTPPGRFPLGETHPRHTGSGNTALTGRLSLADAILAEPRPCHADARAALAALFDRLPGLTVAAVPIGASSLLLGDQTGDTTLLDTDGGEPAAAAACLWLITGRRLPALAAVHRVERRLHPVQRGPADVGQQLDRLEEVRTGLVVDLGDFGQRQQHLRLVHR